MTVRLYDGRVLEVTGPNGEAAETLDAFPTTAAILAFLALTVLAMIAVTVLAWRRRGTWPAVACTALGVMVGLLLTIPAGAGFAMPGLFGGALAGGLVRC